MRLRWKSRYRRRLNLEGMMGMDLGRAMGDEGEGIEVEGEEIGEEDHIIGVIGMVIAGIEEGGGIIRGISVL